MPTLVQFGHDLSGTTAQRPTNVEAGQPYFDTTLGKRLVYNGTAWVESSGASPGARGDGAANGATVSAAESGDGVIHKTVLTLTNTPVSVVSVTTGAGVGGTKVYDLPAGHINVLGCVAELTIAVAAAKQADFTDGTPEGDIGIGSAAPANADALGTDATDDDYGTAAPFTMTAFSAASVNIAPDSAAAKFDGTATAKDVFVNLLVDAADIDDSVTTEVLVTGTITLHWLNLGDVT